MTVMLVWTLEIDPDRVDELPGVVEERRVQVRRHRCRDLRVFRVVEPDLDPPRVIAIEYFDSREDLDSFRQTQPLDSEALGTIERTFAPVGPLTVVEMNVVEEV